MGLGRLGWSLRQIERETGASRESITKYLTDAGIPVRQRGDLEAVWPPLHPATTPPVSTDAVPTEAGIVVSPVLAAPAATGTLVPPP